EPARPLAVRLAVAAGTLEVATARAVLGADVASRAALVLERTGLGVLGPGGTCALRQSAVRTVLDATPAERRRELAEALVAVTPPPPARAMALLWLGRIDEATELAATWMQRRQDEGDPEAAIAFGTLLHDLLGAATPSPIRVRLADALRAVGHYERALSVVPEQARSLAAEIERLRGRPEAARTRLGDPADAASRVVLARIALDAGRPREALDVLASLGARDDVEPATQLRAHETEALALLACGELAEAERIAADAAQRAEASGSVVARARLDAVLGSIAHARADRPRAASCWANASRTAQQAGEQHLSATLLVNLGVARLEAGLLGPALDALREAARRLAWLGRDADLGRAAYDLAVAQALGGQLDLADAAVGTALRAARTATDRVLEAYATVLRAEIAASRARDDVARRAALEASILLDPLPDEPRRVVSARLACLYAELGDGEAARAWLARLEAEAAFPSSELATAEIACARLAVARLHPTREEATTLARTAIAAAERTGRFEPVLRASLLGARLLQAAGEPEQARALLGHARTRLDVAAASLPPEDRASLRAFPAYREALASAPETTSRAPVADERWRRLVEVARELAAERRPARLHEIAVGAALELTGAERALLVERDARDGDLVVLARRSVEPTDEAPRPSRSVLATVWETGSAVCTLDAATDLRLSGAMSLHALAVRSVLAAPVPSAGASLALYADDRLRPGAFGDEDRALLAELGRLLGVALQTTRAFRETRREVRRLQGEERRLRRELDARIAELAALRRVAAPATARGARLVAASAAMQRVLELVERVAPADVPVLVTGESGTGKELVARAIHERSPRRDRPFVTENCGAIPDPLLESALFGHVRGAFTGAERSRAGLFEAAHGGTLLLDEVAEMSPAMQTKLLRAVQSGEIRPVGSDRARRVDVRIVSATHRDLRARVAQGTFREDLFYRLAVVTVWLPPLRERPEDIPPLVAALLERHAPGRRIRVSAEAMRCLQSHPWPGNVRELENELRRALLMATDVIDVEHLSESLRLDPAGRALPPPAASSLRAQIDALERRLVRDALAATGGNQSQAARRLGISRYGLLKMMRRLGIRPTGRHSE
ncbi:MAG: sigma 54-interacting transcriptional regulator, partial [Myxococcota bacterium]|nr:sigma 54-interacting transcriptional regulator [Myxococcota bacterium]